jgi:farnesyl-diphosphate farnesyltransferase
MAVLTLKKIKQNLHFNDSDQVKISRKSVKATIIATRLIGRSNFMLSFLFNTVSRELKTPDWTYQLPTSTCNPTDIDAPEGTLSSTDSQTQRTNHV